MEAGASRRAGMPLHTKILLGLVIGAAAGVTCNLLWKDQPALVWITDNIAGPVGQIFLRLLFMVVIPLVFTSITLGVASLGDVRRIGRVGGRTLVFFLATTALAASLGLTLVNLIRPGESLDPAVRAELLAEYSGEAEAKVAASEQTGFGIQTFVNIIPRNPVAAAANGEMLGVIFFSLVLGIALTMMASERAAPLVGVLESISSAVMLMIGFAMKVAPFGVAGLIFSVTAKFGFDVLRSLGLYAIMVLMGLTIHQFGILPLLARLIAGIRPGEFFRRIRGLMITAFSTSSSNATLPTTIKTAEEQFGVPSHIAGFVLPLGATMNMNGTALFEGMTVLFLAQVFGVDLSLGAQAIVIGMSVITAIGAAGVPSGSIPLLVMVLVMVGVPGEGIALILGVDRILDMARTVPNVTADLITSLYITRREGLALNPTVTPDVS
jgi:DAACS family dicarboxylate/amino acid:cation (Na+ or H+) symporter